MTTTHDSAQSDTPVIFGDPLNGAWPFPQATYQRDRWHDITADVYDQLLNCLPPRAMGDGWFAVGEPSSHDADDIAIHSVCVRFLGSHYVRDIRITDAEREVIRLRGHLAAEWPEHGPVT